MVRTGASIWLAAAMACAPAIASQQNRVRELESKLLAPCCYQEPVTRHQSEVALKMRIEIERLVQDGKSSEEIIGIYKARYGDQVLADFAPTPPWAIWAPWALTGFAAAGLLWWLPRLVRRGPDQAHPAA